MQGISCAQNYKYHVLGDAYQYINPNHKIGFKRMDNLSWHESVNSKVAKNYALSYHFTSSVNGDLRLAGSTISVCMSKLPVNI